jgi:hypothetical protein
MKKQNEVLFEKTTQFKSALDQAISTKLNNVEAMRRLYQQTCSTAQGLLPRIWTNSKLSFRIQILTFDIFSEQRKDLINLEKYHKQVAEQNKKSTSFFVIQLVFQSKLNLFLGGCEMPIDRS